MILETLQASEWCSSKTCYQIHRISRGSKVLSGWKPIVDGCDGAKFFADSDYLGQPSFDTGFKSLLRRRGAAQIKGVGLSRGCTNAFTRFMA